MDNPELVTALRYLQQQLHAHFRLDVKKHYSLLVADAAASTAIAKAERTLHDLKDARRDLSHKQF